MRHGVAQHKTQIYGKNGEPLGEPERPMIFAQKLRATRTEGSTCPPWFLFLMLS
jgi:hypothetical protein